MIMAFIAHEVRVNRPGRSGATGQMFWEEVVEKILTF